MEELRNPNLFATPWRQSISVILCLSSPPPPLLPFQAVEMLSVPPTPPPKIVRTYAPPPPHPFGQNRRAKDLQYQQTLFYHLAVIKGFSTCFLKCYIIWIQMKKQRSNRRLVCMCELAKLTFFFSEDHSLGVACSFLHQTDVLRYPLRITQASAQSLCSYRSVRLAPTLFHMWSPW